MRNRATNSNRFFLNIIKSRLIEPSLDGCSVRRSRSQIRAADTFSGLQQICDKLFLDPGWQFSTIAQLVAQSAWFNSAGIIPDQYRLLFAVGFCGSFTTLSALVLEMNTMMQRNEILSSFAYLMATLIGGFACFYLGVVVMRAIFRIG